MPLRDHWRDVKALHDDGIPLDTTNNETAKLFDATLTQYLGWYNDPQLGGFESTIPGLLSSDPNCTIGRILIAGIHMLSTTVSSATLYDKVVGIMGGTNGLDSPNPYIKLHTQAILNWSRGYTSLAAQTWENLILMYPFDVMAIRFANDTYFYSGNLEMLRDSLARVLPIWESEAPNRVLKPYLHGMYAYGLTQTNMLLQAEKEAQRALEQNESDAWATHALAHAYEYSGQSSKGIDVLEKTEKNWRKCDIIDTHLDWHWVLYELEEGNWEKGEELLSTRLLKKDAKDMTLYDYIDNVSLIYRLKLAGHPYSLQSKTKLKAFLDEHIDNRSQFFNDFHYYVLLDELSGSEAKKDFLRSLKERFDSSDTDYAKVYREVGKTIFAAFDRFDEGKYAEAVELLYPIRNQIRVMGGSNAQRDLFTLLMIHCAAHSDQAQHRRLAKRLINERCQMREGKPSKMMEVYANAILDD